MGTIQIYGTAPIRWWQISREKWRRFRNRKRNRSVWIDCKSCLPKSMKLPPILDATSVWPELTYETLYYRYKFLLLQQSWHPIYPIYFGRTCDRGYDRTNRNLPIGSWTSQPHGHKNLLYNIHISYMCILLDNWASRLIGPNSSTYFEAKLSGPMLNGPLDCPPLNWAKLFRVFWSMKVHLHTWVFVHAHVTFLTFSTASSTDCNVCSLFLCSWSVNAMWIGSIFPVCCKIHCLSGFGAKFQLGVLD